jgi:O-methyltransferase
MKESIFSVYSSQEVLQFTYDAAIQCMDIEGDFIECGVAAGSQLGMMAQAVIDSKTDKLTYGYDSFEGIPYAIECDGTQPGIGEIDKTKLGLLESTGISSHSIENVTENFGKFGVSMDKVRLVKGWFEHTIPTSKHNKIALLRLDGDLYTSTKVCLKHLLKKVSKGGMVIIDDWQLPGCRKAVLEHIPKNKIVEHLGIAYFIK